MERRWLVGEREFVVELPPEGKPSFRGEMVATLVVDGAEHRVEVLEANAHSLDVVVDGRRVVLATSETSEGALWVGVGGRARLVTPVAKRAAGQPAGTEGPRRVSPSFPATVVRVHVTLGDSVTKGQPLVVVSAMKMEMVLEAPYDGAVVEVNVEEGQAVGPGDELVVVEERTTGEEKDDA